MAEIKNLCAQISLDLHQKICEAREQAGLTTAQYITNLLTKYFKIKENGGYKAMSNNNTRTMAFQISEELFQRIKVHLERGTARTGKNSPSGPARRILALRAATETGLLYAAFFLLSILAACRDFMGRPHKIQLPKTPFPPKKQIPIDSSRLTAYS